MHAPFVEATFKRILACALIGLACGALVSIAPGRGACAAAPLPASDAVATVNGKPLSRSLLDQAFLRMATHYATFGPGLPIERLWSYRLDALSQAVDEQLVNDEARGHGITVSADALDEEALSTLKSEVVPLLPVSEEDLREQFATITLRSIAIRRRSGDRWEDAEREARERADGLLRQIRAGADFATLAAAASADERGRAAGGLEEKVLVSSLDPERGKAVASLEVGEVSGVIMTAVGYEIVRVEGRGYDLPPDYEARKPQLRARLAAERQDHAWQAQVKALHDGAAFIVTDPELRAYTCLQEGRSEEALALLRMASDDAEGLGPAGAASVFFLLGARYSLQQRWAEAAEAYTSSDHYVSEVLTLFPDARVATLLGLGHTYENLGRQLHDREQVEQAEAASAKAVEYYQEVGRQTENPSHHDRLRLAYVRLGRRDLAEQEETWLAHRRTAMDAHRKAIEDAREPAGEDAGQGL
jgi:tetratricopeptide (TPR) repeat protein